MIASNRISFKVAQEYFFYDPTSGKVFWIKTLSRKFKPWHEAGTIQKSGHGDICFNYKHYRRSNIIWLLMTGKWPDREVDHINRNPSDDHWENLRLANRPQNGANRDLQKNNTSGYRGVDWHKRSRTWRIRVGKRSYGYRHNIEDAARRYDVIAKQIYGEFAVLNFPEE